MWLGLHLARYLVAPIDNMVQVSEKIRAGNYDTHVDENARLGEFNILARSFNRMVDQIRNQQGELLEANREMDDRRRFTEAVLADVSSGVLSIDSAGKIALANKTACDLLQIEIDELTDSSLKDIMPNVASAMEDKGIWSNGTFFDLDIPYVGKKGKKLNLIVKVVAERSSGKDGGVIITFDDISALKAAQKKAAWSDVARRIAHEIKNPLTPIQLSAERIKRRFSEYIPDEDRDVFEKCIQTISKHVEDIGHMVAEFSSFARMPQPVLRKDNIKSLINEITVMQNEAYPKVTFKSYGLLNDKGAVHLLFDTQQIRQAITNLIQNAVDSLEEGKTRNAVITLSLYKLENEGLALLVQDNGVGFPSDTTIESLTDPYVTRKAKGTGLGLAIVKKIMEDHGGELILGEKEWMNDIKEFRDKKLSGAVVALHFPLKDNILSNDNDSEAA